MGKTRKAATVKDDYLDLVMRLPLRPIHNESEYDQAIKVFESLLVRADVPGLTSGESDYCDVLSQIIGVYEKKHYPLPRIHDPIEMLKFLMDQHSMNVTELGKLLGSGKGQASKILSGKRELSKANIRTLADRFKVSAALFL